jgi:Reverse transcriptase (RNA-dependent DNA polymerase).
MNRYCITQSPLYKLNNKRKLETLLKLEKYELNKRDKWIKYSSSEIPKDDGDFRKISKPKRKIKTIQKRIQHFLSKIERPYWLMSGEKNKCYIDNAKYHVNSNYIITADIKKFYDNCKRESVYLALKNQFKISSDVAGAITDLVTYNGGIPTGAPTSQLIAYYAYAEMFNEINNISCKYGCIFSLYVDDMVFSSEKPINHIQLKKDIDIVLRKYDHKLKYEKFNYYSKNKNKIITGVALKPGQKLAVSNKLRHKIIKDIKMLKDINSKMTKQEKEKALQRIKGRMVAAKLVENDIFPEISRIISRTTFN